MRTVKQKPLHVESVAEVVMSRKTEIQSKIANLQAELNILNRVGDDTFNLGTVLVFAAKNNTVHWYIRKTNIDTWISMTTVNPTPILSKDLFSFISDALESDIGYFEVYELRVQPNPFFTSE
jgi:hypothetical protein